MSLLSNILLTLLLRKKHCWNQVYFLFDDNIVGIKSLCCFFFGQIVQWIEFTQFNCGEAEYPGFEPRPLHIICNIPTN